VARKRDRRKQTMADRRRPMKKKTSILTTEHIDWVDYKDVDLLRRFMSERAKIRARRVTGNSAQQQRAVARAIRVAREMALLPYSVRQVTQRSRGSRRDRERGREDAPLEMPDATEGVGAPAAEEDEFGAVGVETDAIAASDEAAADGDGVVEGPAGDEAEPVTAAGDADQDAGEEESRA
jgi:small subunit ribosomal protein S18